MKTKPNSAGAEWKDLRGDFTVRKKRSGMPKPLYREATPSAEC